MKTRIYAQERVPEYWLVDVGDRSLTSDVDPAGRAYRQVRLNTPGQLISPSALPDIQIAVDALLAG